ncbi:MAG TPA: mandelate racemase/muconate lactonizing enzyme family protein [Burkholderiales bacterium]|nr:mandelate racemase/muconate lactonizing enzyme family protein [Burkholderiales bacterium]
MKITDVSATVLASRYDRSIRFAHMELTERRIILVRVMTDEGVIGLADVDGPPAGDMACVDLIRNTFRPLLVGKDPCDVGARTADMFYVLNKLGRYRSLESYVLGAIDTALWDILGKASAQPIHRLLGTRRRTIALYASLGQIDPGQIADEVGLRAQEGFAGVKIRIGFRQEHDEAIVSEARSALPISHPTRLMADANSGWNRAHAVQNGKRLERHELHWLEEPLPPYDLTGYAHLAANLDTPIAMGEHEIFNRYDARDILLASAADILQPDLRQGISEVVRIAHLASAWDIPCIPHFFGPALRFAAMVHVLAAMDNYALCEYPVAFDPIRFELTDPPLVAVDGKVEVPDGPGLGVTLNEAAVKRYAVS